MRKIHESIEAFCSERKYYMDGKALTMMQPMDRKNQSYDMFLYERKTKSIVYVRKKYLTLLTRSADIINKQVRPWFNFDWCFILLLRKIGQSNDVLLGFDSVLFISWSFNGLVGGIIVSCWLLLIWSNTNYTTVFYSFWG